MLKEPLESKIEIVHQQLNNLLQLQFSHHSLEFSVLPKVLEALSMALEELTVASKELYQQNEELKDRQHDLAIERQRYQELFDLAPDGYLVTDLAGNILEANQAMGALLNVRQERLVSKPLLLYIAKRDRPRFYTQLQQLLELQETVYWELNLQPRQEHSFIAGITISAIHDLQAQLTGLRWIIRDITLLKQAEEIVQNQLIAEQEINTLKSRFTQTIHHEFRNPLGVISASTQLLERYEQQLSPEQKQQCFQRVHSSVEYMTQLLEEICWVDKAQSQQFAFEPKETNVELFCRALIDQFQTKVGEQYNIQFICRGNCQQVGIDPELFRLILSHLVANALKYSLGGSTIRCELVGQTDQLIFSVQDQGIGIDLTDQPHLFQPFYRARNVEIFKGVGLGLTIVKQAVDLHHGRITVESEPGQGSTFTVTLPIYRASTEAFNSA